MDTPNTNDQNVENTEAVTDAVSTPVTNSVQAPTDIAVAVEVPQEQAADVQASEADAAPETQVDIAAPAVTEASVAEQTQEETPPVEAAVVEAQADVASIEETAPAGDVEQPSEDAVAVDEPEAPVEEVAVAPAISIDGGGAVDMSAVVDTSVVDAAPVADTAEPVVPAAPEAPAAETPIAEEAVSAGDNAGVVVVSTMGQIALDTLNDYLTNVAPSRPMTIEEGARHQVSLFRSLRLVLEHLEDDFEHVFEEILTIIRNNNEGAFHDRSIYRFISDARIPRHEQRAFEGMLSAMKRIAEGNRIEATASRVEAEATIGQVLSPRGLNRLLNYLR